MLNCTNHRCKQFVRIKKTSNRMRKCKLCAPSGQDLCHIHLNKAKVPIREVKVNPLTILIKNYEFTLGKRYQGQKGEDRILVRSRNVAENKMEQLVYYFSRSEGGFARLCVGGGPGGYDKGANYITSSFVHMDLQLFIRKQLNLLEVSQDEKLFSCQYDFGETLEKHRAVLWDESRIVKEKEPVFNLLEKCSAGVCFVEKVFANQSNITNTIKDIKKSIEEKSISDLSLLVAEEFIKAYEEACDSKGECLEWLNKIQAFYVAISTIMQKHFKLLWKTNTSLGQFSVLLGETVTITHHLYQVLIQSEESKEKYVLVYSHYTLTNLNLEYDGRYFIVINVIPLDADINSLGLYTKILSLGVYIYKIFEYSKQCSIQKPMESDSPRLLPNVSNCYFFIGDLQTHVWPFDEIQTFFQK